MIYILSTQPSEPRLRHRYPLGSIEHIIMQGRAKVGLTADALILNEGDYICCAADQEHILEALDDDTRAILISEQR